MDKRNTHKERGTEKEKEASYSPVISFVSRGSAPMQIRLGQKRLHGRTQSSMAISKRS